MPKNLCLPDDITGGDLRNSMLAFHRGGVSVEDFRSITGNHAFYVDLMSVFRKHRMFKDPFYQVLRLLEINKLVWKDPNINQEAINKLGRLPDQPQFDDGHLFCITLVYDTGDPRKNLKRNWAALCFAHQDKEVVVSKEFNYLNEVLSFDKFVPRRRSKPRPAGLYWLTCELGKTYAEQSATGFCKKWDAKKSGGVMGIGPELPLIAAMHPNWVNYMNGGEVPYPIAPALVWYDRDRRQFAFMLEYDRKQNTLTLRPVYSGHIHRGYGPCWIKTK